MPSKPGVSLLIMIILSTIACNVADKESKPTPRAKHFIVIGVDGMSPDGINRAETPVMDKMMKEGAFTLQARAVLPTSSSTNWASMVMGAGPEQHGIISNSWERDEFVLPPVSKGPEVTFPTIFHVLRTTYPDAELGAMYHWDGFGRLFEKSALSMDMHIDGESQTAAKAAAYIKEKKPQFLFVHLDHVDGAGHGEGHGSKAYYNAVHLADSLIGVIIKGAEEAGIADETVFLVCSDHGGIGYGHGGETLEEIEVPFILYGKGIKKGHMIKHPVYQYDNAPTAAYVLGAQTPYSWIGRAVKSAFVGEPDMADPYMQTYLAPPAILPKRSMNEPSGGFFRGDTTVMVTIVPSGEGQIIRYTMDGKDPDATATQYTAPFAVKNSCVVSAAAFMPDGTKGRTGYAFFRYIPVQTNNGINFKYFEKEGTEPKWSGVPPLVGMKPKKTGTTYEFRPGVEERESYFAVSYTAFLEIPQDGEYSFYLRSDDGSKMYVEGDQVVNNDGDHGVVERSGKKELKKGYAELRVEWMNAEGGYWLDVLFAGPGIVKQIIPADKLWPTAPDIK